jgi:hypothetical protein
MKWLSLIGVDGISPREAVATGFQDGLSVAIWEAVSGGTSLGTIEPPEFRWIVAVEGDDLDSVTQTLDHIVTSTAPTATGTAERFEEIYRRADAVDNAADDRDVFYARVQAREAVLEPLNHWYNNVHLPEVGGAGLVAGRRFRSLDAERSFLALYRPVTVEVLRSEAIKQVRGLGGFENDIEQFSRIEAHTAARWPNAGTGD